MLFPTGDLGHLTHTLGFYSAATRWKLSPNIC